MTGLYWIILDYTEPISFDVLTMAGSVSTALTVPSADTRWYKVPPQLSVLVHMMGIRWEYNGNTTMGI